MKKIKGHMPQYTRQLRGDCRNSKCGKVFCRPSKNVAQIEKILAKYNNIFICRNVDTLLNTTDLHNINYIIDLYFYANGLFYKDDLDINNEPSEFISKKTKKISSPKLSSKKRSKKDLQIKPYQELEHSFCSITTQTLTDVDQYLVTGLLHLFLKKFEKQQNFNIALIIIRLFTTQTIHENLDQQYYSTLFEVFSLISSRIFGSIMKLDLPKTNACKEGCNCLFQLNFTTSDFENCVNTLKSIIISIKETNVQSSDKLEKLLKIYEILYLLNDELGHYDYTYFYLEEIINKMNLYNEFKVHRSRLSSIIDFYFMIPIVNKAEILKYENGDAMKNTLQDAFFRALFEGVTEPYLFIKIRRDFVYLDTLRIIDKLNINEAKKQLKISFVGEEGIDSGGIRKEYFQLLSQEISNDETIFAQKNNRIWFKPNVDRTRLHLVGKIIGIALYNDVVLNLPFPFFMFKKILGIKLDFEDMEEIEPALYGSIYNLEKCSESELLSCDLYFTANLQYNDEFKEVELINGGRKMKVTKRNFLPFKYSYSFFYTETSIKEEFEAFTSGFFSIIREDTITRLRPDELEKIIMGVDDFNYEAIKNGTKYTGFTSESRTIKEFWSIFIQLTIDEKKKLLQFVTGNNRMPVGGAKALNFTIMRNGCDTDRLPSSQTCFNTLLLPEYSSKEKLKSKLLSAINLTTGFFLM